MTYRNIATIAKCSHGAVHAEIVALKKEAEEKKKVEEEQKKQSESFFSLQPESAVAVENPPRPQAA